MIQVTEVGKAKPKGGNMSDKPDPDTCEVCGDPVTHFVTDVSVCAGRPDLTKTVTHSYCEKHAPPPREKKIWLKQ
jgi:hypothetical protein